MADLTSTRRERWRGKHQSGVIVLLVALLVVLTRLEPTSSQVLAPADTRPSAHDAHARAHGRSWNAQLVSATVAAEVTGEPDAFATTPPQPAPTTGRWLVATVRLEATTEAAPIPEAFARDDHGNVWQSDHRLALSETGTGGYSPLAVGIPLTVSYAIELPTWGRPDELALASIYTVYLDSRAILPLGLHDRDWRSPAGTRAHPVVVGQVEVGA